MIDVIPAVKDIQAIKIKKEDTLEELLNRFYDVMRKHNIKQGIPNINEKGQVVSRTCNTTEWTICQNMFHEKINEFFIFHSIFEEVPEDIQ